MGTFVHQKSALQSNHFKGRASSQSKSRQIPASVASYAKGLLVVSKDFTFRSKFKHANQAYSVLRFLLTKVFDRAVSLDDIENVLLYEAVDFLNQYRNDQFFRSKEGWLTLKRLTEIYLSSPEFEKTTWLSNQVHILKSSGHLLSPRSYLGLESQMKPERFLVRLNRNLAQSPPPKRRIGVGYRDKGTAKIDFIDGCPSWQEVAAHASFDVQAHRRDYSRPKSPLYEIRPRI